MAFIKDKREDEDKEVLKGPRTAKDLKREREEAKERARMVPNEMYDRTNTMLPIGGYLNNFTKFQPNEFR